MKESEIVSGCIKWLLAKKCFIWRNNTGAYKSHDNKRYIRFGKSGSADIIGIAPSGRFIAVECKTPIGILSDNQKKFRDSVKNNNGLYFVIRDLNDLEQITKYLYE